MQKLTHSNGLIDTHVHLNEIEDAAGAVSRAREKSVSAMVAVGMDLASNRVTLEYARRFAGFVHAAIGYHPWSIKEDEVEETLSFLERHMESCVAVGEIGLDYRSRVKKPIQRQVFADLLGLALRRSLPVVVHSRYSHERTHRMVRDAGLQRAVFHWYSGPLEVLDKLLSDGYLISATPALAYSEPHRAAVARAPLDRLLIETDAPVEYQGRVSEPADVTWVVAALAEIKNLPTSEVARVTTANAESFFGI
jgi:TatD DNase family protein